MPSNKWEEAVDKILLKLQVRASMKPSESDLEEAKQAIDQYKSNLMEKFK